MRSGAQTLWIRRLTPRRALILCIIWLAGAATIHAAQDATTAPTRFVAGLQPEANGEEIFRQACATCHAGDGAGSPQAVVGFPVPLPNGHGLPDFTDCATNTVEPLGDWIAVATRGGPIRALDRHMPAFGDALSADQIEKAVKYLWSFCTDPAWPRGDLNLPRPFFTEKAFPENETVWTTGIAASGRQAVINEVVYEHRIGARAQYEVKIPFDLEQNDRGGSWNGGLGDVELALKRAMYASYERGSIFAAGAAVTLPTGQQERGFGNGFVVFEPFAMYGQMLGTNGFLHLHAGYEIPSDHSKAVNELFLRTAVGYSISADGGFGRTWSPMAEVIVARPEHAAAEWDVVPQMQVSLSRLQHVLLNVGVRVPLNEREDRKPQLLTYVLWDWFDGGFFQFWK